ncbi:MAG: hypothetical protein ACOCWM_05875 [Cyclobacteriaceae bacterium]
MKKYLLLTVFTVISFTVFPQKAEIGMGACISSGFFEADNEALGAYNTENFMTPQWGIHIALPIYKKIYLRSETGYQMMADVESYKSYYIDDNNYIRYRINQQTRISDYIYISLLPEFRFGENLGVNFGPIFLKKIGGEYSPYEFDLGLKGSFIVSGNINNIGIFAEVGYMRAVNVHQNGILDGNAKNNINNIFFLPRLGISYQF